MIAAANRARGARWLVSFRSHEFIQNPYPALKQLRETAPVSYSEELGGHVFTRYEDVRILLADNERLTADRIRPFLLRLEGKETISEADRAMFRTLRETFQSWVVFNDPPDHTRLRKLMDRAFRRREIAALRDKIDRASTELLDDLCATSTNGAVATDLITGYANQLPARVIADLLGVPHRDMPNLVEWSNGIAGFVLVSRNSPDKYRVAVESLEQLKQYFSDQLQNRTGECSGVLDVMLQASSENADRLSMEEVISSAILLIFAGHETTTHLISNGMLALMRNPSQLALLRTNVDELLPNCVEEILRYDGPSLANIRLASTDFAYGTHEIKRSDRVFLFSASANRDEAVFGPSADSFDITRANAKRNLTFGFGKHFCVGALLARLEGEIALRHLLARFSAWELDTRSDKLVRAEMDATTPEMCPPWVDLIVTRGMKSLPLVLQCTTV